MERYQDAQEYTRENAQRCTQEVWSGEPASRVDRIIVRLAGHDFVAIQRGREYVYYWSSIEVVVVVILSRVRGTRFEY